MTGTAPEVHEKLNWRFPRTFWIANCAELFERAAFYGMFITLSLYLTRIVGFSDVQTALVLAGFASVIYLLPVFMGLMADRIGFRRSLVLAFSLLTCGYTLLGAFGYKSTAILSLTVIMFGGAIIKPVISATVAKASDAAHRVRAFSIFYQVVNIGAFSGKTVAGALREPLGLASINFYAAIMAWCALIFVVFFYKDVGRTDDGKTLRETLVGLVTVILNWRFMCLILIVAGFWMIQGQLYATMPKYLLRLLGEGAKPEWLANINPLVVVICVVPVTHLIRHFKPENAIAIGMLIIPCTALIVALGPMISLDVGATINLGFIHIHPITLMIAVGIGVVGLAECFLSPKFLEYASKQAPRGEEGLYLGYQHLTTFFAWLFGFGISGYLLDWYCPDPEKIKVMDPTTHAQWRAAIENGSELPAAYAHAHYIWLVFFGVGMLAFGGMLVFRLITRWVDKHAQAFGGIDM